MKEHRKSKLKVTVTNKLSKEAVQEFTKQMFIIYNEIITNETQTQQEVA